MDQDHAEDHAEDHAVRSIYDHSHLYSLLGQAGEEELELFCRLAGTATTILEIASGCGSLALRLGRQAEVLGIDVSEEMIAFASAQPRDNERVSFLCADVRTLQLGKQFDLVLAVDNALQHMCTDEDLFSALASIRDHLGRESRALFQITFPGAEPGARLNHGRRRAGRAKDPQSGLAFEIFETSCYDAQTRLNRRDFEIRDSNARFAQCALVMRILDPASLQSALAHCGFRIERTFHGHAALNDPTDTVQIYECRKLA